MALFDVLKYINLLLKESFEVSPVVFQLLNVHVHIFQLLPFDALEVIFAHLLIHLKHLVQLTTLAFGLLALSHGLIHEIAVHLGRIDIFLETATGHASVLFTRSSTPKCFLISAARGTAFKLAILDPVFHLAVDHTLTAGHNHESLSVSLDLASELWRDLKVAIFVKLTLDLVAILVRSE